MTTPTPTRSRLVRFGIPAAVLASALAVPVLLLGGPSAASAEPTTLLAAAAVEDTDRATASQRVPAELRQALRAAWDAPDGERVEALDEVLQDAAAGEYGAKVERRADRVLERRAAMPAELRQDLEAAVELPDGERRPALEAIAEDALDGGYGEKVQDGAEKLTAFLTRLADRRG